jgi:adenylosuccinate lyase
MAEGDFQTLLKNDPDLKKHLNDSEIEEQFDLGYHFKAGRYDHVFGEA